MGDIVYTNIKKGVGGGLGVTVISNSSNSVTSMHSYLIFDSLIILTVRLNNYGIFKCDTNSP